MSATCCTRCGQLYDARGDAADEPGHLCPDCWHKGFRNDSCGNHQRVCTDCGIRVDFHSGWCPRCEGI